MPGEENKVQFNIKNLHYAPMTATGDTPTWGTPVKVPGTVSLTLEPVGEVNKFYADGIVYYQTTSNSGYEGDLEVARFPVEMRKAVWKENEVETDFVMIENANIEPVPCALLFQIDGDKTGDYYLLYNCTLTRPSIEAETTTESKEVKTQTCTVSAAPLANGNVLARTTAQSPDEIKNNWFTKVYEKPASPAA